MLRSFFHFILFLHSVISLYFIVSDCCFSMMIPKYVFAASASAWLTCASVLSVYPFNTLLLELIKTQNTRCYTYICSTVFHSSWKIPSPGHCACHFQSNLTPSHSLFLQSTREFWWHIVKYSHLSQLFQSTVFSSLDLCSLLPHILTFILPLSYVSEQGSQNHPASPRRSAQSLMESESTSQIASATYTPHPSSSTPHPEMI